MNNTVTRSDIKRITRYMRVHALKPLMFKTQEEVDSANARERALGLTGEWKIGDEYYRLDMLDWTK